MTEFHTRSAEAFLSQLSQTKVRDKTSRAKRGLAPMQRLLDFLGNPEQQLPKVIHITGSKGKGSTALTCEAILQAGGLRTATFTSPHLISFCERFRIDGAPIAPADFEAMFSGVRDFCQMHPEALPTFSEALTAAALKRFSEADVDVVILEVGVGGALDPTNVVNADVAIVTTLELEHTKVLGETMTEIATEKAGIFKPQKQALIGQVNRELMPLLARLAYQQKTTINFLGESLKLKQLAEGWRLITPTLKLDLPSGRQCAQMVMPHQRNNTALAVAAVTALGVIPAEQLLDALRIGLTSLSLRGKLDWQAASESTPARLIDSAHTPNAMQTLVAFVQQQCNADKLRITRAILSVAAGKSPEALLAPLLPRINEIYLYQPNERSMPTKALKACIEHHPEKPEGVTIHTLSDNTALQDAFLAESLDEQDLVIVAGSTYLAGEIYRTCTDESRLSVQKDCLSRADS